MKSATTSATASNLTFFTARHATDLECLQKAKEEGKQVEVGKATPPADTVRCVATDVACLKNAKQAGKKVDIVEDVELDTVRCTSTDVACLKQAKVLGKKVEITA